MKKSLFLIVFCSAMAAHSLAAFSPIKNDPNITHQISKKLTHLSKFNIDVDQVELKFNIDFIVNTDHKMVIVNTSNKDVEHAVKSLLNDMVIEDASLRTNKIYTQRVIVQFPG